MPDVVIIGAGPAGMVLAYQLASNGVKVRVVERHPDFKREFRGDLLQKPVLDALETLGLISRLRERGLAMADIERRMFGGTTRQVLQAVSGERGSLIQQAGLLELLHEQCAKYPHYRLDFSTTATELVKENGAVTGVKVRRDGAESTVTADVFVVCNGRNSGLRKDAGLEVLKFSAPNDVLWLRFDFSDAPELLPKGVDVHMHGKGVVTVYFPVVGNRLQVAFYAPGDMVGLRKDVPALKARLLPTLPERLRARVEAKLDEKTEWQVLKVQVDRLAKWHAPGVLFIGDAAHTMSPAGGQGLNLAIRDAIATANHFLDAVRADAPIESTVFQAIEAERRPEIESIQNAQLRIGQMVQKPLAVLHIMFTMFPLVMKLRKGPGANAEGPVVAPRYAVKVA